jgi:hypothetical protein
MSTEVVQEMLNDVYSGCCGSGQLGRDGAQGGKEGWVEGLSIVEEGSHNPLGMGNFFWGWP